MINFHQILAKDLSFKTWEGSKFIEYYIKFCIMKVEIDSKDKHILTKPQHYVLQVKIILH